MELDGDVIDVSWNVTVSYGSSPVNMYAAEIYGFYFASPISQNGDIFFNEDLIMVKHSYGNIPIFDQIILVASLSVHLRLQRLCVLCVFGW